jgi:hypothetical protein
MKAKDLAMMAWIPAAARHFGATSREEPHPKAVPATMILAPCLARSQNVGLT